MKKFEDFTVEDLKQLRSEISLNSLYIADYRNSFGISAKSVSDFFDGFMEYIGELAAEDNDGKEVDLDTLFENYDNIDNLEAWYYCHDEFSWVEYEEEDQE